ncbi:MAG: type IV secretion system DNA-binding domain-containing protein, partial [Chloroflexi bacterium]|nr:type IV secretion system DNA-binding domain-containing protein [Chloroflexota bacterium]
MSDLLDCPRDLAASAQAWAGTLLLARPRGRHPSRPRGDEDTPDGWLARFLLDLFLRPERLWRKATRFLDGAVDAAAPVALRCLVLTAVALIALRAFVVLRDRRLRRGGRRLRIQSPPEVAPHTAEVLWTGLHGFIRPRWRRVLFGQPALTWELRAREDDVELSLWVPDAIPVSYVERAIASAWPGASIVEVDVDPWEPCDGSATAVTELRLARPQWYPIGEGPDADPIRLVLAALANLDPTEGAVMQIVAQPVPSYGGRRLIRGFHKARRKASDSVSTTMRSERPSPPGLNRDPTADAELRAVHSKAAAPLWQCIMRLAVAAPSRGRAKARVHSAASAFAMFEGTNGFRRRRVLRGAAAIRARKSKKGLLLSVGELARVATLPEGDVPGFEIAGARSVSPPKLLPQDGRTLGRANSGAERRPVALSVSDCRHHLHVLGTGTGKSTLLAQLALEDAAGGRAAVVVDPKGDLVEAILQRLPKDAEARTCLIDPTDSSTAVGLNVLAGPDHDLVTDQIVTLFKRIYENHWGPRSDDILRAACLTLCQIEGATLAEVPLLLTRAEWRKAIRPRLADPALRLFWEQFDNKVEARRQDDISPLMNKLRAFLLRSAIRTIVGQTEPRVDLADLIESGGLVLVRIPKGLIGEDTSRLLGGMVIARVWQIAMSRANAPEDKRPDLALYVDEMHNYLTLPRS